MPKKAIRIPAARTGRGVRWTLQVSADPGEGTGRAQKPASKRTTSKQARKPTRKHADADKPAQASSAPAKRASSPRDKKLSGKKTAPAAAVRATPAAEAPVPVSPVSVAPAAAAAALPARAAASLSSGRRLAAIAVGAVLVMALMSLMRDPSRRVSSTVNAQPATLTDSDSVAAVEPALVTPPTRMTRALATSAPDAAAPVVATTRTLPATAAVEKTSRSVVVPAPTPAPVIAAPVPATPAASAPLGGESIARAGTPESTTAALTPKTDATPDLVSQAPVTITGCLEGASDGDRFRLTDTEGAAAPKARGWRSGFIKKRNAAVELVDLREPVALRRLVGHRVVATGLLDSRELRVRSVASAGATCD